MTLPPDAFSAAELACVSINYPRTPAAEEYTRRKMISSRALIGANATGRTSA